MVIPPIKRYRFIWIIIKIHHLLGDDTAILHLCTPKPHAEKAQENNCALTGICDSCSDLSWVSLCSDESVTCNLK
jgi:hypothetical protein